MSEVKDRKERQALRAARQAKRAARAQEGEQAPGARKQARMARRAERAREAASKLAPVAGKPKSSERGGARSAGPSGESPEQGMQTYGDAMLIMRGNVGRREYPNRLHENCRHGMLIPDFTPKFKLDLSPGAALFTIGAGFARDLEPALAARGVSLPTTAITIPQADYTRPENPLNEYTARTIAQRIDGAFKGKPIPQATIIKAGQLFSDQLMPGKLNVPLETIAAMRQEIAGIYGRLRDCGAVVITLSTIESWYDAKSKRFFNRPPPATVVRSRSRHIFLDVRDSSTVVSDLIEPLSALGEAGIKVVLVVSPAAQPATFLMADAVCANELAKSTLRVAAEQLMRGFDHVDYFPALEIARSAGLHAYMDDNVQLRHEVSALLVETFIKAYAA